MTFQEKVDYIKSLPLFAKLSNTQINFIAKNVEKKEYAAGELIIKQEDATADAYFIVSGAIKVYRVLEDGKIVNLSVLGSGEIIGELSLIDGRPRSASVKAMQKTIVLVIKKKGFDKLLARYPQALRSLLEILALRLRLNNLHLEKLAQGTLVERTMITLKNLAKFYPENQIPLSHEELSEIIGATRARITEVLNHLSRAKQLILSRKKIILLN